jgi:predicted type IV restriction endonuclease
LLPSFRSTSTAAAAQVVKYASVLGLRWGIVTDGRYLKVYDPRIPNVKSEERLVFEVDLAGYSDRELSTSGSIPTSRSRGGARR